MQNEYKVSRDSCERLTLYVIICDSLDGSILLLLSSPLSLSPSIFVCEEIFQMDIWWPKFFAVTTPNKVLGEGEGGGLGFRVRDNALMFL